MSKFPDNPLLLECLSCKDPLGERLGGFTMHGVLHRGDFGSVWLSCNGCGQNFCVNLSLSTGLVIGRLNGDNPDHYKEVEVKLDNMTLPGIVSMVGKIKHALT